MHPVGRASAERNGDPAVPVVLVTGASSGIGLAVAERLHEQGWTVIGASRRGSGGRGWQHERIDVDDEASVAAGIGRLVADHGRLDAVVCAAGRGVAGSVELTPDADARQQFETNFWGTARTVRTALPHLRATCGRVVVVSSIAGGLGLPFQSYYAASKFALEGWAESLHWELQPFGVKVTLVQPGNIRTGFTDARRTLDDAAGPYAHAARQALTRMEQDERAGADPDTVAGNVVRVLELRNPPLRLTVGPIGERAGAWARRFLPFPLFARMARRTLCG